MTKSINFSPNFKSLLLKFFWLVPVITSCSQPAPVEDRSTEIEKEKSPPRKTWLAEENPSGLYEFKEIDEKSAAQLKSDELLIVNSTNTFKDVQIWNSIPNGGDNWYYQYSVRIYENESETIVIKMGYQASNYRCRVAGDQSGFVPIKRGVMIFDKK